MGANGCSREMICSSFGGQQTCPMALVAMTKLGSNQPAALFRKEPTTASHTCTAAVCFPLLHVFVIFRIYFWLGFPSALQLESAWGLLPSPVLPVWVELVGGRGQQMMAHVHMPAILYIPAGSEHPGTAQS